jgi:DNA-binding NarL/FixJ family response regulator
MRPIGSQVIAQLLAGQQLGHSMAMLTARERQLLALTAEGHSNTAIAQRWVVSASAVEKHSGNVFATLRLPPDDSPRRRVLAVLAPGAPTGTPLRVGLATP